MEYKFLKKISLTDFSGLGPLESIPLLYFKKGELGSAEKSYNLYVSVIIPENDNIDPSLISFEDIGATKYITVKLGRGENTLTGKKIVYFQLKDVPPPPGYKVATLVISIVPPGVGDPEGKKSSSADYGDADDNP